MKTSLYISLSGPLAESKQVFDALNLIRTGESNGQTFRPDGTIWNSGDAKLKLFASFHGHRAFLTPAAVQKVANLCAEVLASPGSVLKIFKHETRPHFVTISVHTPQLV